MSKDLKIFTSNKKKNAVLGLFDIPYRYGKNFGTIVIKLKRKK